MILFSYLFIISCWQFVSIKKRSQWTEGITQPLNDQLITNSLFTILKGSPTQFIQTRLQLFQILAKPQHLPSDSQSEKTTIMTIELWNSFHWPDLNHPYVRKIFRYMLSLLRVIIYSLCFRSSLLINSILNHLLVIFWWVSNSANWKCLD